MRSLVMHPPQARLPHQSLVTLYGLSFPARVLFSLHWHLPRVIVQTVFEVVKIPDSLCRFVIQEPDVAGVYRDTFECFDSHVERELMKDLDVEKWAGKQGEDFVAEPCCLVAFAIIIHAEIDIGVCSHPFFCRRTIENNKLYMLKSRDLQNLIYGNSYSVRDRPFRFSGYFTVCHSFLWLL